MQDFYYNIIGHRLSIGVKGKIEGSFKLPSKVYEILDKNQNIKELVFILRKVTGYNDEGIKSWIENLGDLSQKGYKLTFLECPKTLLTSIKTQGPTFSINNIKSFAIPYYCEECNEEYYQIINTNSVTLSFSSYANPLCSSCKKTLTLDITEDEIEKILNLSPEEETYSDKRKYPRFDLSAKAVNIDIKHGKDTHTMQVINFSEAGLCLQGSVNMSPGASIKVKAKINKKTIETQASIVWHSIDNNSHIYGLTVHAKELYDELYKLL